MPRSATLSVPVWTAAVLLSAQVAGAQKPCNEVPLKGPVSRHPIYFTEQQEMDFGDAIAEHGERFYQVVNDDTNDHLQAIGTRIVQQFPETELKFQFRLVNLPTANAFTLPGARIYVTRKLVASVRSEDELAGVLAHEIGHAIARHASVRLSRAFREKLQVTTFGDRRDIFEKYRRLIDSTKEVRQDPRHEDQEQFEADRLALQAAARAGYSPAGFLEWWDRTFETGQQTGNVFTDLFGTTRPESRRLREMLRSMKVLPPECRTTAAVGTADEFLAWQRRVVAGAPASTATGPLPGVAHERPLEPPLRGDIVHLRFSPDGRHALAQDDSSIYVLTRDPFEVILRIDADDARPAQFTPDSRHVVFDTIGLRVERWDLASRTRVEAQELFARYACVQTLLSPDGRLWACVDETLTILLRDVPSGETIFKREWGYRLSPADVLMLRIFDSFENAQVEVFELAFSPDSRYLIVGNYAADIVVDVAARSDARLPGAMRKAFRQSFAFLGADRVVTVDPRRPERSAILQFPSGEVLRTVPLGGDVSAATRGEYVMIRPIKDWPVGVVDMASGQVVQASRNAAFDIYDHLRLGVQPNGDIALYAQSTQHPLAVATLPRARLGRLSAADVSPGLKWIALSGRDRGGVWKVDDGSRVAHMQGFRGAYMRDDGSLHADFPPRKRQKDGVTTESERSLVRFDAASSNTIDEVKVEDWRARQLQRHLLALTPSGKHGLRQYATLEVRDVTTHAVRWRRQFPEEAPRWFTDDSSDRLILLWPLSSFAVKDEMKADRQLRERADAAGLKDGDAYLEVLNAADGTRLGRLPVPAGRDERRIRSVISSGDTVVVLEYPNQVTAYSLSTGERRGSAFGRYAVASAGTRSLCVQNDAHELAFFDLESMERQATMRLPSAVRLARFSADGTRLLLVTADQVVRVLDVAALVGGARAARR